MSRIHMALALACALSSIGVARADDWTADKLRGQVLQLVDGQWQPLNRGMVVPDSRVIRTLAFGRVTFTRGGETVEIGPNTQIQIYDEGGRKPFTTVKQYFGSVSIEAEVQQVQHFAVQTPYLAAVVKGTRFTVRSGDTGATVSVERGHVEVASYADRSHTTIAVGQSATVGSAEPVVEVSGSGDLPAVLDATGQPEQGRSKSGKSTGESSGKAKGKDKHNDQATEGSSSGSDDDNSGKGNPGNGNSGKGNSENSGKGNSGNSGKGSSNGKGHDGQGDDGDD